MSRWAVQGKVADGAVGHSQLNERSIDLALSESRRGSLERTLRNSLHICRLECHEAIKQGLGCLCRLELRVEACRLLTRATLK